MMVALIVSSMAVALAGAGTPRMATGNWVFDYAEAQCSARRQFGTDERPLFLIIKPSPTSELVQLNVVKKKGVGSGAYEYDAQIAIGQADRTRLRQLSYSSSNNFEVQQVNLPAELAKLLASADRLSWSAPDINATFETGDLGPVMTWLSGCRDRMRAHWNIGDPYEQSIQTPARANLMSLFSSRDYPRQSLHQGDSGIASVIVLVDDTGRPRGCMLDQTSGIASLDSITCAAIRERAKFKPAIGADGKPVRSHFVQRVHWDVQ